MSRSMVRISTRSAWDARRSDATASGPITAWRCFRRGGGFYHDEVSTAYFAHKKGQELAAMPEAIQATVNRYVASLSPEEAAFIDTGKAWH